MRYGFNIQYPEEWISGVESDNSDGKRLYIGNPNVDIVVYASHHIEGISGFNSNDLQHQRVKLESGIEASMYVGVQENMHVLQVYYLSTNGIEYHFSAIVDSDFYNENEKKLIETALSFTMPE